MKSNPNDLIPQASPRLRIALYHSEISQAIDSLLDSDQYILGRPVEEFENAFAAYCGVTGCVAVNSGTDAIEIALRALGIGPGDEVITVAMTAPGTVLGILNAGAEPRFIDIDPQTFCMNARHLESAITARTAAVIPVHLYGYPMDMRPVMDIARRHGIAVVEDCAHAHGAQRHGRHVGTFGHAGVFSFYPTKNLGCIGDGGAIVASDPELAERMRRLRSCGAALPGETVSLVGLNSRLDALQAAVLSVLLRHLDEGNRQRADSARYYRDALASSGIHLQEANPGHVYHQFVVSVPGRDALRRHLLDDAGIVTGVHYTPPLHRHPAFSPYRRDDLPHTEHLADSVMSLPIQPEISMEHRQRIADAVIGGMAACAA